RDDRFEVSRITFFAVTASIAELKSVVRFFWSPHGFVESLDPAVKMIPAIVDWQGILDAVQDKSSARNAIRMTSDQRAEVSRTIQISFQGIVAKHHVVDVSICVRHIDRG